MKTSRVTVLVVGAIMQLFLGVLYIWSVFVAPVSKYFNMPIEDVKLTSSFMLASFVAGILFGGKLQKKISVQKIVLIGGILLSSAMALTAVLPSNLGMAVYVTYGVLGGVGVGMGYNAIITASQQNFPDKRGIATGVSVCTFGFSTVIFTPIIQSLESMLGLQSTLLILAVSFFVVTLACFSFVKMPEKSSSKVLFTGKQYETSQMLKTKTFYFITASMMFGTSVFFILNPSFFTLASERGLTTQQATLMVMLTGVASAIGRLLFPIISDKTGIKTATFLTLIITTIGAVGLIFAQGVLFIVVVIAIACCYGGTSGTYPILTGKHFGLKNIGANYGCVMVGFATSALIFPMIIGFIDNINLKFITLAVLALVGSFLVLALSSKTDKE